MRTSGAIRWHLTGSGLSSGADLSDVHVHVLVEGDILYINMVDVLTDIAVEIVVGSVGLVFLFHN